MKTAIFFLLALSLHASATAAVVSEIKPYGGAPTIWIDGKPSTGCMFWSGNVTSDLDIAVMRQSGIHLYQTGCAIDIDDPSHPTQVLANNLAKLDQKIERIVRVDPAAKVLVRVGTRIPFAKWWKAVHPEELVRYYDIEAREYRQSDWPSPSSPSWNAVMYDTLRQIIRHVEAKWSDTVFGYQPGACSCSENLYEVGNKIADFSPAHLRAFGRPAPDLQRLLASNPFDFQRLLNPVKDADLIAFRRFQSQKMGETACQLSHTVKDELRKLGRNKICGAFYGYMSRHVSDGALFCDGHQAQEMVYSSPDVDFISAPIDYTARQLGGAAFTQCMPGAIAVRGKLYYAEEDSRLYLAREESLQTAITREESRWTLLRNFFDAYSHGGAIWWMDLFSRGWYRDEWFAKPLTECRAFADRHFARRESVAEIAVFVHPDALACERAAPTLLSNELISGVFPEICAIGAPYDVYHLSDIGLLAKSARLAQYKMAVLLNAHTVSDRHRELVRRELCRDRRTVVFLGPAGWNGEKAQGENLVRELTGFDVREVPWRDGAQVESFVDGRRIVFGSPLASQPTLVINDPAVRPLGWRVQNTCLASTRENGGAVLAEKSFDGWKGILCTANFLPSDLLRRFAAEAGVHIYSPHGDQVFAGPGWFAIAAKMSGPHRLQSRAGQSVEVNLRRGEVRYFESDTPQSRGHERKRFVALGWDVMWATPQQLLERADEFERTGISGIVPTLFGELPDGTKISPRRLMHEPPWTEAAFAKDAPVWKELLSKPCFSRSFAGPLRLPVQRVAWTNDAWWARVAGNMRVLGKVTRDLGFYGIEIDHEDYPNAKPMIRRDDDPPYAELVKTVRRRACEIFTPFFDEFPNAVLFGCRFFSVDPDFWNRYYYHPDPLARAEKFGDLWPAFLNGLLDAMPLTSVLVEGDESGYRWESSRKDFHAAYARLHQRLWPLIAPENRGKYRALSRVAFPLYLDMYSAHPKGSHYYRGPVDGSRNIHCERNLTEAFDASDEFAWVYGERAAWVHWPVHPDKRAPLGKQTWDELLPGLYAAMRAKTDPQSEALAQLSALTEAERAANGLKDIVEGAAKGMKTAGFHPLGSLPRPFVGWQAKEQPGRFGIVTAPGEPPALCAEGVGRGGIMFSDGKRREGDYMLVTFELKGRSTGVYSRILRPGEGQDLITTTTFADSEGDFSDWHRVCAILRIPDHASGFMVSADMEQKPGERLYLRNFLSVKLDFTP